MFVQGMQANLTIAFTPSGPDSFSSAMSDSIPQALPRTHASQAMTPAALSTAHSNTSRSPVYQDLLGGPPIPRRGLRRTTKEAIVAPTKSLAQGRDQGRVIRARPTSGVAVTRKVTNLVLAVRPLSHSTIRQEGQAPTIKTPLNTRILWRQFRVRARW